MKTYKEWAYNEQIQDSEWEHIKSMKFQADPEMKNFISPKIGRLQEQLVQYLQKVDPEVKNYRDVPPEIRDKIAQAIISVTLDLFFDNIGQSIKNLAPNDSDLKQKSPSSIIMPQDEFKPLNASKG